MLPGLTKPTQPDRPTGRALTMADAIDIWIARWLRVRRIELCRRYSCDPRRLYEIWSEDRFIGSRAQALVLFLERYPSLGDRVDTGRHKRVPKTVPPSQLGLFE